MPFKFDPSIRQSVVYPLVELLRVLNTADSYDGSEVGTGRADWSNQSSGVYGDVWVALAKVVRLETGLHLGDLSINYGGWGSWILDLENAIELALEDRAEAVDRLRSELDDLRGDLLRLLDAFECHTVNTSDSSVYRELREKFPPAVRPEIDYEASSDPFSEAPALSEDDGRI